LRNLARARLADAEALLEAGRFDGGAYLCGYVVELALKARICRTLRWDGYPEKKTDFEGFQTFKTHDLDVLLRLSGREHFVKSTLFVEWTAVSQWNPEARYRAVGQATLESLQPMIAAARTLLQRL
jgi:HEPN domain-containing protein